MRAAASREAVALFEREMVTVGGLDHPGIVRAHDAGERDGHWYMVMEFVEGADCGSLARKHGTLPVAESCEIIRQAALALHHAHGKGLVHRDVKPGNLMIAQGTKATQGTEGAVPYVLSVPLVPSVKVLDFGLASLAVAPLLEHPTTVEDDYRFLGTLEYVAPEQIEAPAKVDARADIYALGATLRRFLTGTPIISISGSPEFTLTPQPEEEPTLDTIPGTQSTYFIVRFTPTSAGTKRAVITIQNNDSDEGTFTFSVDATAVGSITSTAVDDDVTLSSDYTYTVIYPLANDLNPDTTISSVSNPAVEIYGPTFTTPDGFVRGGRALLVGPAVLGDSFTYTTGENQTATVRIVRIASAAAATKWNGHIARSEIGERPAFERNIAWVSIDLGKAGAATGTLRVRHQSTPFKFTFRDDLNFAVVNTPLGVLWFTKSGGVPVVYYSETEVSGLIGRCFLSPCVKSTAPRSFNVALNSSGLVQIDISKNGLIYMYTKLDDRTNYKTVTHLTHHNTFSFTTPAHVSGVNRGFTLPFITGEFTLADLTKTDVTGEFVWARPTTQPGEYSKTVRVANGSLYNKTMPLPTGTARMKITERGSLTPNEVTFSIVDGQPATTPVKGVDMIAPGVRQWRIQRESGYFSVIVNGVRADGYFLPKSNRAVGIIPKGRGNNAYYDRFELTLD